MKKIILAIIAIVCFAGATPLFGQQTAAPFTPKKEYQIEYTRLDNSMLKVSSLDPDFAARLSALQNGTPALPERPRLQYQRLNGSTLTTFDAHHWAEAQSGRSAPQVAPVPAPAHTEITLMSNQVRAASGGTLLLSFSITSGTEVSLEIVTTQGKSVLAGQLVGLQQGQNTAQIPLPKGLRGVYLFRLRAGNATANGTIVVQ